jgi:hypothetical protein
MNDGDREALLANPDAIEIPLEQLAAGWVFVSELDGVTVGFSAIELRVDGETELDALFVAGMCSSRDRELSSSVVESGQHLRSFDPNRFKSVGIDSEGA